MTIFLNWLLILHLVSGFLALATGFLAMVSRKASPRHRLSGKVFFTGMTGVFITASLLAVARPNPFLFMVGFFSYYLACSGYRALHLKQLHRQQKPQPIDWLLGGTGIVFGLGLLGFSVGWFADRGAWGLVPLAFGLTCLGSALSDLRRFQMPPTDRQPWVLTHSTRMGGSFAATVTAFIVVNVSLGAFTWVLWILPGVLVGLWSRKALQAYQARTAAKASLTGQQTHKAKRSG